MIVNVYHNVATDEQGRSLGRQYGYEPAHLVLLVFTYKTNLTDDLSACAEAYRLLNVGHDPDFGRPDPRALNYRAKRNR